MNESSVATDCFFVPDLKCFDFASNNFVGGVGEINPMLEFMLHSEAHGNSPMTSPTVKPTHQPNLDLTEKTLEFLLEELQKMPVKTKGILMDVQSKPTRGQTTKPHPKNPGSSNRVLRQKVPDEKISYQATLKHYEDILDHLFFGFKKDYKKEYRTRHEHERRKDIYRHNMR